MESPVFRHVVVRHVDDCPTEEWTSPTLGSVCWWELFGGDATATNEMTVGIAEVHVMILLSNLAEIVRPLW